MSIKMLLKRLADMVFPYIPRCVSCGVEKGVDAYLCAGCAADMQKRRAGASGAGAYPAFSAYRYDGPVARLVRRYKYGGDKWLCACMADAMAAVIDMAGVDAVCHVPLHGKRRRSRGFDQAEALAKRLAAQSGRPFVGALRRVRNTRTQTRLNARQRQDNMRGAFESVGPVSGRLVLVDDVLTTGATAAECAAVLTAAGAQSVTVLTFAQAVKG